MIYDLSNHIQAERFLRRSAKLLTNGRVVELREVTSRTRAQNSYLHLILGYFALEYGETMEYVKEKYFKRHVNSDIFVEVKNDTFLGKLKTLRSSADISKEEMSIAIERFKMWSVKEAGITLPDADNGEFLREIEIEIENKRQYL